MSIPKSKPAIFTPANVKFDCQTISYRGGDRSVDEPNRVLPEFLPEFVGVAGAEARVMVVNVCIVVLSTLLDINGVVRVMLSVGAVMLRKAVVVDGLTIVMNELASDRQLSSTFVGLGIHIPGAGRHCE